MPRLAIAVAAVLATLACIGPPRAEARVVAHHGVWDVSCPEPGGTAASGACMLLIELGNTPDLRSVAVSRRADGHVVVRLTFVVGIYLPRGVDIAFDGDRKGRLPFQRCLAQDGGCFAEFDATPLLERFKAGGVMTLAFSRAANSDSTGTVTIDGFAAALAALDAHAPPPPAVDPDAATAIAYGSWQMVCQTIAAGAVTRRCNVIQSVRDQATGNVLSFVVLPRPDQPPLMHVAVSGDVLVRQGLALAIDGQSQGVVPYDVCGQVGCTVTAELVDTIAERFKAGTRATFTYKVQPNQTVAVSLALDGFGAAIAALGEQQSK